MKLKIPKDIRKKTQKKRQQERPIENVQMLNTAQELIAAGDLETIIDFAIEANRTISQNQAELEIVKEYLRARAVESKRSAGKTVEFSGHLGKIAVTFPSPEPKPKPGVDLLACLPGFSESVSAIFQTKTTVTFAPGFSEKIEALSDQDQKVVENLLELVPATPRISFPEGFSSLPMWPNTSREASSDCP